MFVPLQAIPITMTRIPVYDTTWTAKYAIRQPTVEYLGEA